MSKRFTYNGSFPSFVSDYSIEFDGIVDNLYGLGALGDYSFVQNTGVFSVGAWIKLTDNTATTLNAVVANAVSTTAKGFFFGWDNRTGNKKLIILIVKGSGGAVISATSTNNAITDNNWHYIEFKSNGTNGTFYVDDVALVTYPLGALSTGDSTYNLMIGQEPQTVNYQFYGRIHRTALWNVELTAGESTSAYNTSDLTSLSTDGNLISYLRMTNNGGIMNGALGVNVGNRIFDMKSSNYATPSAAMTDALNKVADTPYP